jgi:hypothetical protein
MEIQLGKLALILDTRIYEVQFPDGHMAEYTANVIAECIYSQVDDEGHQYLLLDEIIDYMKTDMLWKMKTSYKSPTMVICTNAR